MVTQAPVQAIEIHRRRAGSEASCQDWLAVEAPLLISVDHPEWPSPRTLTVTLRTPGHDAELALGYLYAEGVLEHSALVATRLVAPDQLRVELAGAPPELSALARSGPMHGGCGVCGKLDAAALWRLPAAAVTGTRRLPDAVLRAAPAALRAAQQDYAQTGGVHAVALYDYQGQLKALREDIGRHNALDKLIGAAFRAGSLPWQDQLLLLSGRASAELIHKAWHAGASVVAAIGAPSTLAVSLAEQAGITLIGFLRADGYNVYTHPERLQ